MSEQCMWLYISDEACGFYLDITIIIFNCEPACIYRHCAKNWIYAIGYFAYISSLRIKNPTCGMNQFRTAYFEYPQPHHVRLEGFTKQCLRIPLCDTLHVYGVGYALRFCSWYTSWILNLLQSKTYTYNNQYPTFKLCSYRGKTPLLALQLAARVAQQSIATRQRESCASCWPALQTASPQNSYSNKKGLGLGLG